MGECGGRETERKNQGKEAVAWADWARKQKAVGVGSRGGKHLSVPVVDPLGLYKGPLKVPALKNPS